MREYKKPMIKTERFIANQTVAACDRKVIGTETTKVYNKQTVQCIIGNQEETVFNTASGCTTSSSQWGVTEYNGTMYFVWYTYSGDIGSGGEPSTSVTNLMNTLVTQLGFTTGSGWHYSKVTSNELVTDVLGFSY